MGYVGTQAMRLASNLVLTRLLMPEAFGTMALVNALVMGLMMFSDMGTGPAIQKSRHGDEPEFLDTVWSVQALRGVVLWVFAALIAWPVARFYGEPIFAQVFPVAALSLVVGGLMPTRMDTAMRHLLVGRLTMLELLTQLVAIVITVVLAAWMQSVWALVIGGVIGTAVSVLVIHLGMPGHRNRFRIAPGPMAELMSFGRWIFLSTIAGFLIFQGDRLVLGRYLTLQDLGIYNIAYFLGSVPSLLGAAIAGRLFIPLYRDVLPGGEPQNAGQIARVRLRLNLFLIMAVAMLALGGPWLVRVLYDPRYEMAGHLVMMIALIQIPALVTLGYEAVPLARGDSRRLFMVQATRAVVYVLCLLVGAHNWGLYGALGGQATAGVILYPVTVAVARHYQAWSPRTDLVLAGVGALVVALAWAVH